MVLRPTTHSREEQGTAGAWLPMSKGAGRHADLGWLCLREAATGIFVTALLLGWASPLFIWPSGDTQKSLMVRLHWLSCGPELSTSPLIGTALSTLLSRRVMLLSCLIDVRKDLRSQLFKSCVRLSCRKTEIVLGKQSKQIGFCEATRGIMQMPEKAGWEMCWC